MGVIDPVSQTNGDPPGHELESRISLRHSQLMVWSASVGLWKWTTRGSLGMFKLRIVLNDLFYSFWCYDLTPDPNFCHDWMTYTPFRAAEMEVIQWVVRPWQQTLSFFRDHGSSKALRCLALCKPTRSWWMLAWPVDIICAGCSGIQIYHFVGGQLLSVIANDAW